MTPPLVLPLSNNNNYISRNSPIDCDYYFNDQQSIDNDYYDYNNNNNDDVRSSTSTPVSEISWSSPNTNDDPSLILSNNDGKN